MAAYFLPRLETPAHSRPSDDALSSSSPPGEGPAWISVCAARLGQLMPRLTAAERYALAQTMRREVGYFDPAIAAELEIESWPTDD